MSIAVAVKKADQIVLATDSLVSFGASQVSASNYQTDKMMRVGDSMVASTGWALYDNLLHDYLMRLETPPVFDNEAVIFRFFNQFWKKIKEDYSYVNDQCDDKNSPFADLDANFLIVNNQGIFSVSSNLHVVKFEQFYTVGSGGEYAMGALQTIYNGNLDAQTIAKKAVETAIALDTGCGGKINVHIIN
tara:strand:+ start:25129 stop:25695 length:567 start_codon:yes stop_codon:yes gene_type:complete